MRLSMILAVARAEIRSNRRLARYWVYAVLALFMGVMTLAQFTFLHGMFSGMSATVGTFGPRYLIAQTGLNLFFVFLVGLTFLAFDVRARDERDRMVDVLDSRPLSNAEFMVGKVSGLVLITWLPLVLIAIFYESFGALASMLAWPVGDYVEPFSLLGFLLSILVALILWCSILVLLAVVIRYRVLVAAISFGLIGLQYWGSFNLPMYIQHWVSLIPTFELASNIVPQVTADNDGLRMLGHLLLAFCLLTVAIIVHPRRDGTSKPKMLALSLAFLVGAGSLLGANSWQLNQHIEQRNNWLAAHVAKQALPRADMQSLTGSLILEPGDRVKMDLDIVIQAPADESLETILLTLNPGLEVSEITVNDVVVDWTHESGLIEIGLSEIIAPGIDARLTLKAAGEPDESFGYLDTYINRLEGNLNEAQIGLLGIKPSIFDSAYIAMPPGAHWLPSTGTDTPIGDPRTHPLDYFILDLEVTVPENWLVAGPGRRTTLSNSVGAAATYRFNPSAPVPHVGLIASQFVRKSMQVADIEFEILLYPGHIRNLAFFEESEAVIKERINDIFVDAENLGLAYPYDGLSLVETPNALRGYGGGWRMDSVQSMAGVMMLRENSFPTSRFEIQFRNPKDFEDREGGVAAAKLQAIEQYFENDFNGGNLFSGISRNVFQFQTSATGEGAAAINFLMDELAARLLTGKRGYFSAHEFDNSIGLLLNQIVQDLAQGRADRVADTLKRSTTHKPSVWDRALGASLADLDLSAQPRTSLNVLALKSEAIARMILDGIGRQQTAILLSEIVKKHRGAHFELADIYVIAAENNIELEPLLGDWLHDAALPGFLLSEVQSVRLKDDKTGNPQYQTRVFVTNDEDSPGLIQMRYQWGSLNEPQWDTTGPMRVAARSRIEVGIVTPTPLFQLWSDPYLSLNRTSQRLLLTKVDSEVQLTELAFSGFKVIEMPTSNSADIIVDDLDTGFSIWRDKEPEKASMSVGFEELDIDMDQGLPEYQMSFGQVQYWARAVYYDSFGRYRRTHTLVHPGEGDSHASFTASLPHQGRWRLSYYLGVNTGTETNQEFIPGVLLSAYLGKYEMTLVANGERQSIEFDGQQASFGWNDLGEFDLPAGEASLEVKNVTSGLVIIADAIRWRPVIVTSRPTSVPAD